MKVPVSIIYLKFIWHLGQTGKQSTRVCRVCAALVSPSTRAYLTTSTGKLSGIGPRDVICVACADKGTDGIAPVAGVDHEEV